MRYDVIVIGGGLGGLTAGARLAKEGKRVLLIEQHSIPGGCATTFRRKDFTLDVGLHEIDGLSNDDLKSQIFKELGILDRITFLRLPEFYRFKHHGVDIVIPDDHVIAGEILRERFPDEKKGIEKFFNVILLIRTEIERISRWGWKMFILFPLFPLLFPSLFRYSNKTLGQFLDRIIKSEELKLVLSANFGYYHDDPYELSLLFFGMAQSSFLTGGGHYIQGGSQRLSDCLVHILRENGGTLLLRNMVTRIITKDKKAIGVVYRETAGKDITDREAFAQVIIANAAIPNVLDMLPGHITKKLRKKVKESQISCSLFSLYLGFKKPLKELGNSHYSTFVFPDGLKRLADIRTYNKAGLDQRGFVFVDYSQIDSQLAPEGKSVGAFCTFDYLSDWEGLSDKEYREKKDAAARAFIERLDMLIPGAKDEIEYYEAATAKTIKRYTLNPEGTPYGFAQTPRQTGLKRIPQKSPVKNLYFASAWTMPGGGFTGAILSGYNCAEIILRKKRI